MTRNKLGFSLCGLLLLFISPLVQSEPSATHQYPCALWEDSQGISHLKAETESAAYACFGYIHGRDRAWEMDYLRRTVTGNKAEILGSQEIRSDYFMRTLHLTSLAEAIFDGLTREQRQLLLAYSHGVNRGFSAALKNGVYELKKWNTPLEAWKPADSIGLILLQSFDQTKKSFLTDYEELKTLALHGEGAIPIFIRDELPWDSSILKKGEYPSQTRPQSSPSLPLQSQQPLKDQENWVASLKSFFDELPDLTPPAGIGSNNWVISPSQSKSGHAWLANDPHLELRHPSLWHWIHLESPHFDAIGAALPGIPLIVSGANRHLAWGLTNSYLDVADLHLISDENLKDHVSTERPLIWFKFWKIQLPFFFKSTSRTIHNRPILPLNTPDGKSIVLNWTGFDLIGLDFSGFFELMKAKTAQEADLALSHIGVPSWNFVFADTSGHIGYRAIGRVPRRESVKPYGLHEESLETLIEDIEKQSLLTTAEMPHLLNPLRGWIATANNRQWPIDSKFFPGRAHAQGFRHFRIEELLGMEPKHDFASLRKIQCDTQAIDARFILPLFIKNTPQTQDTQTALDLLKNWDFQAHLECKPCGLYRRWMDIIRSKTRFNSTAIYRLLQSQEHPLRKQLTDALLPSLREALIDFKDFPPWKQVHRCLFPHLGGRDFFEDYGIPTPGDEESVNPGNAEWGDGFFRQTSGASQRLIVELTSPPTIYSILPGSIRDLETRDFAEPTSPWQKWVTCDYEKRTFPLDWTQVQSEKLILN